MTYPLIILGAGASMDYLRADDHIERRNNNYSMYRAPLMNQLFDDTRFYEILDRHHKLGSFATTVMNAMSRSNANFEDYLTNARDNLATNNPEILSQLVSLIFYLADLFTEISNKYYYPRNNYRDLLQSIDNYCNGQACIVNFNYDLLLEKSLTDHLGGRFDIRKVSDYVNTKVKIIKIHGACNWRYNPYTIQSKEITANDFFIPFSKDIILSSTKDHIFPLAEDLSGVNFNPEYNKSLETWTVKLPALALPLKSKPNNYVCEESHITMLKECIKRTDRILIIGWRGTDTFLFSLLKDGLEDRHVKTIVVTKNSPPESVIAYYRNNILQLEIDSKDVYQEGFSEFMKTNIYGQFLQT